MYLTKIQAGTQQIHCATFISPVNNIGHNPCISGILGRIIRSSVIGWNVKEGIMGFWIFMLIMELLIPFTMIGMGRSYMKKPPEKINSVTGYRTSMSMKNRTTWEFSVIIMCLVIGHDRDTIGNAGLILCAVQMIFLAGSIIPTEISLKKKFDKNGRRR